MFQDCSLNELSFPSTWRNARETAPADTQTEDYDFASNEAQTVVSLFETTATSVNEAQTTLPPCLEFSYKKGDIWVHGGAGSPPSSPTKPPNPEASVQEPIEESLIDERLLGFLEAVAPDMMAQLQQNVKTSAFDGYEVCWEEESTQVRCLHTLTCPQVTDADLQVTDISWNSSGSAVAASYGQVNAVGWCYQKGYICIWNVLRDVSAGKPDQCFDVDSYVTTVAFHPEEPSLLAAGTYNGEILLYNIAKESDYLVMQTESSLSSGAILHSGPVAQLLWVVNKKEARAKPQYLIVSVGGDGKILIWSQLNNLKQCVGGYEVSKRGGAVGVSCLGILQSAMTVGLSSKLDVPSLDSTVLIGTEAGHVHRTNIKSIPKLESVKTSDVKEVKLVDPVISRYEGHLGPVNSLDCSPSHPNLFLTCSSDGSLKLFSVLEASRLHLVIPSVHSYLYCAQWSPTRPFVFACASKDSNLYFFDLQENRVRPAAVVQGGSEGQPLLSFRFNPVNREYLATGDGKGHLRIWRLSDRLCTPTPQETAILGSRDAKAMNEAWFKYAGVTF